MTYLMQAKDSVTGEVFHWLNTTGTNSGFTGPNTATELAIVATNGADAAGGGEEWGFLDPVVVTTTNCTAAVTSAISFWSAKVLTIEFTLTIEATGTGNKTIDLGMPPGQPITDIWNAKGVATARDGSGAPIAAGVAAYVSEQIRVTVYGISGDTSGSYSVDVSVKITKDT